MCQVRRGARVTHNPPHTVGPSLPLSTPGQPSGVTRHYIHQQTLPHSVVMNHAPSHTLLDIVSMSTYTQTKTLHTLLLPRKLIVYGFWSSMSNFNNEKKQTPLTCVLNHMVVQLLTSIMPCTVSVPGTWAPGAGGTWR